MTPSIDWQDHPTEPGPYALAISTPDGEAIYGINWFDKEWKHPNPGVVIACIKLPPLPPETNIPALTIITSKVQ